MARAMLPPDQQPKIVTTLHGTDTTLLGRDADYVPAIRHALNCSDAVTTVSDYLRTETQRLLNFNRPIDVIHNFFEPRTPKRSRKEVRAELGMREDQVLLLHSSNLRRLKRVDLLLEAAARLKPRDSFKLLILAGESFAPFAADVRRLGIENQVIIRDKVNEIEDYLQAADLGVVSSETESFCLSILEAMCFACPSVSTSVGGIPEVLEHGKTGLLVPFGDAEAFAGALQELVDNPQRRQQMGLAAKFSAERFSADAIVPQYEAVYRRVRGLPNSPAAS
jgi:N-acetyl-alpha-D-glucosaminyl L-malate synthase BshA